ncbi:MAG: hypothetical protein IPF68_14575 [Bacteroidales bacterium]|nr:hypothetical protein [Bacteroidales bacterium]
MRRLLPAILIFFVLQQLQGQSIYSLQQDDSWPMKYSVSRKADLYTNQVIKQLALAHLKIPEKTSFTFFFNFGASVGFQQGNMLDVSVSLTPSICTGDVEVRDFDLQKILIPSTCAFRVSVIHPVKGEVFASSHEQVPLSGLLAGISVDSFSDSLWSSGCRISVEFRGFLFDEPSYRRIEKELYAIRDYDAASALADTLEKKIRKARIRLHTPTEAFRTYVFCKKSLLLLNEAVKTRTEIVPGNDPRGLLTKVPVIRFHFEDLTEFYNTDGVEGPLSGNPYLNLAQSFGFALNDALILSQKVDYYSSPFYYRLFSNSTSVGQLNDAAEDMAVFSKNHRLGAIDFGLFSRRKIDQDIRTGEILMQEGRYAEAVDLLNAGHRFCSANPAVSISEKLTTALLKARSGLTASYIRIVQKALDNNLPGLADKYLTEAMKNAAKNGMTAADSAGFAGLYGLLTGKNIQAGNQYLNSGNYQSALAEFDKAMAIATQFNLSQVADLAGDGQQKAVGYLYRDLFRKSEKALDDGNAELAAIRLKEATDFAEGYPVYRPDPVSVDSLNRRIAMVSYHTLLGQAAELVKVSEMKPAVELLLKAATLSRDSGILNTAYFDSLVMKAGSDRVNALLSEGRLKLWAGEPERALELAGEATQLISALGLGGRQDIKEQYSLLMQVADESLCSRIKGELTSLISQAGEAFSQNKFSDAAALVFQAREMIYSKASCGLNTLEINKLTTKYEHPVRWNEMVRNAGVLIAAGDFTKGIEVMQQAGAVFNYYRLDTLGLVNTGLYEFAIASDHIPFIRHATGHYITRGGNDQALRLLDRMRQAGATPAETYELQESLARVLAERDVAETEMTDVKVMLNVYTSGNKWYKRFAEVYRYHVENH